MMHQKIDKKKKIYFYIIIFLFLSTVTNLKILDDIKKIFLLNKISIESAQKFYIEDIRNELSFLEGENILFINHSLLKEKLNKINYLEKYDVFKKFPSSLIIKFYPTSLAAKIYLNKKNLFIGKNGNIIEFHSDKEKYKLPEFFGNYNKKEFLTLISIIDEINFGYQNINSFYFFLNERWDIKTNDGVLIKLPKKNLKNSLIKAKIILNDEKIKKIKIIDLRISNNLIITHV